MTPMSTLGAGRTDLTLTVPRPQSCSEWIHSVASYSAVFRERRTRICYYGSRQNSRVHSLLPSELKFVPGEVPSPQSRRCRVQHSRILSPRRVPFTTARFHVATGPASLFRRVEHIMKKKDVETLRLTDHARSRWKGASMSWTLVNATVRTDTGKFVSSAWRCETVTRQGGAGQVWLVVVGLHEVILTAFPIKARAGKRGKTIKSGKLYDMVQQVNQALMDDDDDALINNLVVSNKGPTDKESSAPLAMTDCGNETTPDMIGLTVTMSRRRKMPCCWLSMMIWLRRQTRPILMATSSNAGTRPIER
jgi:hypothetical protein